jgi:hypothetical protein
MKYLLPILVLVFATHFSKAQSIPEKANTIVITLPDSNQVVAKIIKAFESKDYTTSKGKNPMLISTAQRTLKNGTRVAYMAEAKGKEIILTGKLPVAGQPGTSITYQGKKGTPMMNGWEEMEKIAKAFGGTVRYETR